MRRLLAALRRASERHGMTEADVQRRLYGRRRDRLTRPGGFPWAT